ncbi:MAG: prephenate dehydrogenase/arogenate dehydrogenase family protein [Verrucomicrobiae bacterium]|nr:prephenate dehydrogenase/arogenate dehydrogenase family protein [Verrucomicrobiae bacterium]
MEKSVQVQILSCPPLWSSFALAADFGYHRPVLCHKLTIIGVGLLGGSLGMAAKERNLAKVICGYVRRKASLKECVQRGAVDYATLNLHEAVSGADLVVLCTPVGQMEPLVEQLLPALSAAAVVTYVGSGKDGLVQRLEKLIHRAGAHFVGSHPMAGAETTGVKNARKDLFDDAVCIVTPTKKTSRPALEYVKALWNAVGARTVSMAPSKHDELVARSSHLPHLIAVQLVNFVLRREKNREQEMVCANGFRDSTRIASGSPEMWRDIALANRRRLTRVIDLYINELRRLRSALLEANPRRLERLFVLAKKRRDAWVARRFNQIVNPCNLSGSHRG